MTAPIYAWPLERASTALAALVEASGLDLGARDAELGAEAPPIERTDKGGIDVDLLGAWLEHRGAALGCEIEPTHVQIGELDEALARFGPALLLIVPPGEEPVLVALCQGRAGARSVVVLGPDLKRHRVPVAELVRALAEPGLADKRGECSALLEAAQIPEQRRAAATEVLLRRRLATAYLRGIWQLRLPPSAAIGEQLRRDGVVRSLAVSTLSYLAHYVLLLASWWVIGSSILRGHDELGWLIAWALLLASIIPLRAIQSWQTGVTALRVGAIVKSRLLAGALALEPDELRTRGIGRLLALVIESQAVESLAISTGFASVAAIIDLALAGWVLGRGAGGGLLAVALWAWLALVAVIGWRYIVQRRAWARQRLAMTHALVERMVGHTTRLAQQQPARWHEDEDAATASYLARSRVMDRLSVLLRVAGTRGWMLIASLGLFPVLVTGEPSTGALAIAFGGVLLAQTAFTRIAGGLVGLADLTIAWTEVGSLADAATRLEGRRSRVFQRRHVSFADGAETGEETGDVGTERQPVIEVRELGYRYPSRERPALRACDLAVAPGERLLLEGPSGGGKSTFAALLTGLRDPDAGLLLLDGLDRATHGELGWRRRVAAAPQFHQNHVLTNTFAFNLLMGRRWPPRGEDLALAHEICVELGLGPLLERMPAGMMQNVGETGWQLSHGERSRLFLARALLQGAELVILDESLAALDPANQGRALECAFARAPTLLVIAHP